MPTVYSKNRFPNFELQLYLPTNPVERIHPVYRQHGFVGIGNEKVEPASDFCFFPQFSPALTFAFFCLFPNPLFIYFRLPPSVSETV